MCTSKRIICINRIRLEFKVRMDYRNRFTLYMVLIESDWNLKTKYGLPSTSTVRVLIESDWNLKEEPKAPLPDNHAGINRIRLEFKGCPEIVLSTVSLVLIESDWNLKKEETEIVTDGVTY